MNGHNETFIQSGYYFKQDSERMWMSLMLCV